MNNRASLRGRPWRLALAVLAAVFAAMLVASPGVADPSLASTGKNTDPQSTDNLDPLTLATMRAQEKLQPALQAVGDEQMRDPNSGYAGVAFEGDGLTLYWKGNLTPGMSAALGRARAVGPVTVKPAAYSSAELHAESAKLDKAMAQHGMTEIQTISFPVDGSGLGIERAPAAELNDRRAFQARAGRPAPVTAEQVVAEAKPAVPVHLTTAMSTIQSTSSRFDDSPPWNGGDEYEIWHPGGVFGGNCTTGFGVHASGRSWVLTAAHCAAIGDKAFQGGFLLGPVNSDQWVQDLLLIDTQGWHVIFDGTSNTTNKKNVNSWGYWAANELVCQSGYTSGTVCGIKEQYSTNWTVSCNHPDSDGRCNYDRQGLIQSTQINGQTAAQGGDSGGPVFTLDGSGVRAKGISSAAGGPSFLFQDWADVITLFGAYPNTSGSTS